MQETCAEWMICALSRCKILLPSAAHIRYAPNVRLLRAAGCSLSVTADVRAKGSSADVPDNRPLSRDSCMYWPIAAIICWLPGAGAPLADPGSITACRRCQLTGWLTRLTESGPAARSWGHRDLAVMYTRRAPRPSQRVIVFICYCAGIPRRTLPNRCDRRGVSIRR
jgi:hypothetical protein